MTDALPPIARLVRSQITLKWLKRIWGGLRGDVFLVTSSSTLSEENRARLLEVLSDHPDFTDFGLGAAWRERGPEFWGVSYVRQVLWLLYPNAREKVKIVGSDEFDISKLDTSNVVLFGGPRSNPVTRYLIEQGELEAEFDSETHVLTVNRKPYDTGLDPSEKKPEQYTYDHGLLWRKRRANGRYTFVLAGCRSYGTQAAAAISTIAGAVRELRKENFDSLMAVCKIQVPKDSKRTLASAVIEDTTLVEIVSPPWQSHREYPNDAAVMASWSDSVPARIADACAIASLVLGLLLLLAYAGASSYLAILGWGMLAGSVAHLSTP